MHTTIQLLQRLQLQFIFPFSNTMYQIHIFIELKEKIQKHECNREKQNFVKETF